MAVTPYKDLTTQDILSAHISGLSHSIKKIETVLNMKTEEKSFSLYPVTNQEDVALRYRIYEGSHRNWLSFSLTRNGDPVQDDEFISQPEYGVIVFNSPQLQTDSIDVTATIITDGSTKIEQIDSNISSLSSKVASSESRINALENNVSGLEDKDSQLENSISSLEETVGEHSSSISTLKEDVQDLQVNGGGGSSDGSSGGIELPLSPGPSEFLNVVPGKSKDDLTGSTNVLMAGGKIDAMPIIVEKRTKITRLRVYGGSSTAAGTIIMGIYSDADTEPAELLGQTESFSQGAGAMTRSLIDPVYLDPGVYWVARWASSGVRFDGHKWDPNVHITFESKSSSIMDGSGDVVGVRSAALSGLSSLPNPFPSVGSGSSDTKYLARGDLGTVYALR